MMIMKQKSLIVEIPFLFRPTLEFRLDIIIPQKSEGNCGESITQSGEKGRKAERQKGRRVERQKGRRVERLKGRKVFL